MKVETHTVPPDLLGPQRGRREIGERLADAGPGLGEQQVGRVLRALGREHLRDRLGHRALALARLGAAGQLVELRARLARDRRRPSAAAAARRLRPIA